MYRHINRNIEALLRLLLKQNHVQKYDDLMNDFDQPNAVMDQEFQHRYAHFWAFGPTRNGWRPDYFNFLHKHASCRGRLDRQQRRTLLEDACRHIWDKHQLLIFAFATKLVHMVDPTSPIYDGRVRAFYFLPELKRRMDRGLTAYDALVREYDRVLDKHLLDESIARFQKELNPGKFTPIKIVDSLIWAFVTWADQRPAFVTGKLQYE